MIWKSVLAVALTLLILPLIVTPAYATATTTVVGLINAAEQMDGQKVIIEGEVVGDIINADAGHKWLTLQDGEASISIYVSATDAEKITNLGRYGVVGTRIEASGIFQVDCFDHDGLTDVHVERLTVLDEGQKTASVLSMREVQIGILLVVVGVCLVLLHRRLRERTR